MSSSRRDFVQTLAAAGGVLSLGRPAAWHPLDPPRQGKPLNILILGGTGFIGPHEIRYAVARGHKITVFNRGRRQADLPASVKHLTGDRNGQLDALKGNTTWDVVIDNPTTFPRWVRTVGEILKGRTDQYVFISTLSVYDKWNIPKMDESAPLATMPDPNVEEMQYYGAMKVLAEREAEKWYPGKVTVIRPGLIVGPGDETDRFTYWPVRIARGGEVLAPPPGDAAQIIDARDLAEWTIRMCESRTYGTFNATGPRSPLSQAEMLAGVRAAMPGSLDISWAWADAKFLEDQKVRPWGELPVWIPNAGDTLYWGKAIIDKAVAAGLTFRPLALTAADTLAWHRTRPADRQENLRAGMKPEREAEVLKAYHARMGS
ncbi:MAG: NAD-dependent epimerase/dehydratase family protein [Gemmatimonadales bacterium]